MVEAVISVVIVSGMMLASITTLGAVCRARRVQAERQEALALAHGLMTEILQSYYLDPASTGASVRRPGRHAPRSTAWTITTAMRKLRRPRKTARS